MFTDYWEVENQRGEDIWPLMIGKDREDPAETASQISVILDSVPAIPDGNRVLEVGAGVGRLLRAMASTGRFSEVYGVDSSMSIIAASQLYLEGHQAEVVLTDGINLPFPDGYFDFVYSFTVYQHMISLAIIHRNLCEVRRVLKPGGLCRIQTISSNGNDPRDLKTYDGRVFRDVREFAQQFEAVGLDMAMMAEGLSHPKHAWVTARRS